MGLIATYVLLARGEFIFTFALK